MIEQIKKLPIGAEVWLHTTDGQSVAPQEMGRCIIVEHQKRLDILVVRAPSGGILKLFYRRFRIIPSRVILPPFL